MLRLGEFTLKSGRVSPRVSPPRHQGRPSDEAQSQAILDGYLKDANLLPELRFWVANQGVALSSNAGYRLRLERMLSQLGEDRAR